MASQSNSTNSTTSTDATSPLDQILEQAPPVTINGAVVEKDLTPIPYQSPRRAGYRGRRSTNPPNSTALEDDLERSSEVVINGNYRSPIRSPKEEQAGLETSQNSRNTNSMSQNSASGNRTHSVPIRRRPEGVRQRMETWRSPEPSEIRYHNPTRTELSDLPEQNLSAFSTVRTENNSHSRVRDANDSRNGLASEINLRDRQRPQRVHASDGRRSQRAHSSEERTLDGRRSQSELPVKTTSLDGRSSQRLRSPEERALDGSVHSGSSRRPANLNVTRSASSADRSVLDVELSQRRSASRTGASTTSARAPRPEVQSPFTSARTPEERKQEARNDQNDQNDHSAHSRRDQSVQIRSPFTNKSTRQLAEEREAREIVGDLAESYQSQASQQATDLREQLEESFLNSYREQVARDVAEIEAEEQNSAVQDLYPNMPDYDSMNEFEQIQAHAEFENIFESIYTLFPDANRIDTRITLKQKYVIYHSYYRRIQVLQRAEAYMMIMGVAWAVMECFIERFIGNGYFLMQWQKRNKYAIALERLAEMTIPQGDGAMGNPLYEIAWGCGLDLGALVVVNVLHRLFRNRMVAEQIYNILKGFISTAMQKLNAPAPLPGAPGEARAAPPPESMRGQQNTNASWVEGTLGAVPNMVQMGRNFLNNLGNGNAPAPGAGPAPAASGGQAVYYDN